MSRPDDYILPSSDAESVRLEQQASLYGGTDFLEPFLEASPGAVLEVGSGTGFFARHVAERLPNARVVGVDLDVERLAFAREAAGEREGLEFVEGDLHALPFADDAFELVYARFALLHATDPAAALREMARVCRPGGRVVAYDMIHDGIWFSPEKPAFTEVLARTITVMRERGMEPSQGLHLPGALRRAGLEEVQVKVIPHHALGTDPLFEAYRQNWLVTLRGLDEIIGAAFDGALLQRAVAEVEACGPDDFLLELTVLAAGRVGSP